MSVVKARIVWPFQTGTRRRFIMWRIPLKNEPFHFLVCLLLMSVFVCGPCLAWVDGDCVVEAPPASVFVLTGAGHTSSDMNKESCISSCLNIVAVGGAGTVDVAGITNGNVCLCGKDVAGSLVTPPTNVTCDMNCTSSLSESGDCGGDWGAITVYSLSTSQPASWLLNDLTFSVSSNPVADTVIVENVNFTEDAFLTVGVFMKKYMESSVYSFLGNFTELDLNTYLTSASGVMSYKSFPQGSNTITLRIESLNGSGVILEHFQEFDINHAAIPIGLDCPLLFETGLPFPCYLVSTGGRGNLTTLKEIPLTTTQDALTTIDVPASEFFSFGHPVPTADTTEPVTVSMTDLSAQPIVLLNGQADFEVRIHSIEWWGDPTSTSITLTVYDGQCVSGTIDSMSGYCESTSYGATRIYDTFLNEMNHTCSNLFQSTYRTCIDSQSCLANAQTCQTTPYVPDSFVVSASYSGIAADPAYTGNYKHKIFGAADPVITIKPGQFLGISGAIIGYNSDVLLSKYDRTESGLTVFGQFMFRAMSVKPETFTVYYSCLEDGQHVTHWQTDDLTVDMTFPTECQTPIENLTYFIDPIIRLGDPATLIVNTTRGNPIAYTIDWAETSATVDTLNVTDNNRSMEFTYTFTAPGNLTISGFAYNLHCEPALNGMTGFTPNFTQDVYIFAPVVNWQIQNELFHVRQFADFEVWFLYSEDPSQFLPTSPFLSCIWTMILDNATHFDPEDLFMDLDLINATSPWRAWTYFKHFDTAGEYTGSCTLMNLVSNQTLDLNVTVYDEIVDFYVYPRIQMPGTTAYIKLFGSNEDTVPSMLTKVTLFPEYTTGTIEEIAVYNNTDTGEQILLGIFNVTDRFNPRSFLMDVTVPPMGTHNLTIVASNELQVSPPFTIVLQSSSQPRGLKLDDFEEVTDVEETKYLYVYFETVGSGTCLLIDFKDGIMRTFGDPDNCATTWPDVIYDPSVDLWGINPIEISHVYYQMGIYNVSAWASSDLTNTTLYDELVVVVSSVECNHPEVTILKDDTSNLNPLLYGRGETIVLETLASLNCSGLLNTLKHWRIFSVTIDDPLAGTEVLALEPIETIAPASYTSATLSIVPGTLDYGLYKVQYFCRMWDLNAEDPYLTHTLPFERDDFVYIEIFASPLVAGVMEDQADFVTRGGDQLLTLETYIYSFDPDDPEAKDSGFTYRYFCRQMSENFTYEGDGTTLAYNDFIEVPDAKLANTDMGGCFGNGPGALDNAKGYLMLPTKLFMAYDTVYEIVVEVYKDFRMATKSLKVLIIEDAPPIMHIECADTSLCFFDATGQLYVNPSNRLALRASCDIFEGSNCKDPLEYKWSLQDINGIDITEDFTLSGFTSEHISIKKEYFQTELVQSQKSFQIVMTATNGDNITGISKMFYRVNMPPSSGSCTVSPLTGMALIDKFLVSCFGWTDPEDIGIKSYKISVINLLDNSTSTLSTTTEFNELSLPSVSLSMGNYRFKVAVEDKWGSVEEYLISEEIVVNPPSNDDLTSLFDSALIEEMEGTGDEKGLLQLLKTQSEILEGLDLTQLATLDPSVGSTYDYDYETLSVEDRTALLSTIKGNLQLDAMEALLRVTGGEVDDLASAEMMASVISSIVGSGPENGDPSTVGVQMTQKATEATEALVKSLLGMDISTPAQMVGTVEQIAGTLGLLLQELSDTATLDNDYDATLENTTDLCKDLKPIDVANSDSPDFQYDTRIDSVDMVIPEDKQQQRCGGVVDAARETGASTGAKVVSMLSLLAEELVKKSVLNEKTLIEQGPITIYSNVIPGEELKQWHYVGPTLDTSARFAFTKDWCLGPLVNGTCRTPVGVAAVSYDDNPLCYVPTCDRLSVDSKTLYLSVLNEDNVRIELKKIFSSAGEEGISIDIPRTETTRESAKPPTAYNVTSLTKGKSAPYLSHNFNVSKADSAFSIEFYPDEPGVDNFALLLSYQKIPTYKEYEFGAMVSDLPWTSNGEYYEWYMDRSLVKNRTGRWFLTVMSLRDPMSSEEFMNKTQIAKENIGNFSTNYRLRTWTSGCYYFDEGDQAWIADGTSIHYVTYPVSACRSHHLTHFSSGFFIVPNTIDFNFIFTNFAFEDNMTIYMTVIVTLASWLILLIYARIRDMLDEKKLICHPLVDNNPKDSYLYEILAFTGNKKQASCKSKVQMVLTGENGETPIRTLDPGWEDTLKKGCVDSYVMRVPRPLGNLNFLRVWHDNRGRDRYASWYCGAVIIKDLQTGKKYEFLVNRWLAVEKDDGEIDRLVSVSGESERTELKHLFRHSNNVYTKEYNLWFSIFERSNRFRFTRCQRVTTCMALLYLGMLFNAFWYHRSPEKVVDGIKIGKLIFNFEEVFVGLVCNLCTLPLAIVLIFLFKKSRRRKLRSNRINEALKEQPIYGNPEDCQKDPLMDSSESEKRESDLPVGERTRPISSSSDIRRPQTALRQQHSIGKVPKEKKFVIHWFWKYVGWLLCFAIIGGSLFFLWVFALHFGNEKTFQWLTSTILSFFVAFLIFEPLKVFLMSCVTSVICKKFDLDDDVEMDEEDAEVADIMLWADQGGKGLKGQKFDPIDEDILDEIRKERVKEVEMWAVIRELFGYIIFILIVFIISFGNRDRHAYLLKSDLENSFVKLHGFDLLVTSNDWWDWAHATLIPQLRAQNNYNGNPPYGLRGYIGDYNNRMMGYAVLRQVRVVPNSCRVDSRLHSMTQECARASSFIYEDDADYCNGWQEQTNLTKDLPSCQRNEFKYTSAKDLDSLPYTADMDAYGGGGYVFRMNGPENDIRKDLLELQRQHWLNNHTRAVFLEFSVYNPNVNLFGICTLIAEFLPGGGIKPFWRIEAVRLLNHLNPFGKVVLICEILFIPFIISFILQQFHNMRKQGRKYWKSYWVFADWGVIFLAFVAVGFYAMRYIRTGNILTTFNETKGNGYVKLQYVGLADELYSYSIGLIFFVSTIKLVKLLRFHNTFQVLLLTLRVCWDDLSGFLPVFGLIFFAFVQVFYMILHTYMFEFRTVIASLETCFTMLLNKFKFGGIRENSLTAAVMFFVFAISCSFILINVMLTMIIDAFERMKEELAGKANKYEILDFMTYQSKINIGIELAPPTKSALKEDNLNKNNKQQRIQSGKGNGADDIEDSNVKELPHKVDMFLDYINTIYFDGEMDVEDKNSFFNHGEVQMVKEANSKMGKKIYNA